MVECQYGSDDFTVLQSWRLLRIIVEFVDGFDTMADTQPAPSVPGVYPVVGEDPLQDGSDT